MSNKLMFEIQIIHDYIRLLLEVDFKDNFFLLNKFSNLPDFFQTLCPSKNLALTFGSLQYHTLILQTLICYCNTVEHVLNAYFLPKLFRNVF